MKANDREIRRKQRILEYAVETGNDSYQLKNSTSHDEKEIKQPKKTKT